MGKERIKTLLLTLLIIICITLGVQICLEEKLWSQEDYDFFSVFTEKFNSIFNKGESTTNINVTGALDSIFSPRVAVLSYPDGRITVNFTDDKSKELRDSINGILKQAVTQTGTPADEQQWKNALTTHGIYADFSVEISFNAISDFLGESNKITTFSSFDRMVIVLNNASLDSLVPVYFCNSAKNQYLSVSLLLENDSIHKISEKYSGYNKQNMSYAFEINLDKKLDGENSHQKIVFDSYVRLNLDMVNLNVIESSKTDVLNEGAVEKITDIFKMNYKTAKKYIHSDNKTLYVDSNCVITLSPDGVIEYEASSDNKGISISDDSTLASSAAGCAKLIDDLLGCFEISKNTRIFINSPLNEDNKEEYIFDFDYLYNSISIYSKLHPCSATVKNGKITKLRVDIKSYELKSEGKESNPLEVIDIIYESMGEKDLKINNLYFGYFDKNGETTLSWLAKVEGSEDIIIIN